MKKIFKWAGILIGSLLLIGSLAAFIVVNRVNGKLSKKWEISVEKIYIPSDSTSIEWGKYWSYDCQVCHGPSLGGKMFFDDPKIGRIFSSNLTAGQGGIGAKYSDEDWVRAIKHGIGPTGKSLFVMPSKYFNNLNERDLGCLIAYLKKLPKVDNDKGGNILPTFTKFLIGVGAFGEIFSSEAIDHKSGFPSPVPRAVDKFYGKYICDVTGCYDCHGANLGGGKDPNPKAPFSPNLTPGGNLNKWKAADFIHAMRTGITPERKDKPLNPEFMAWPQIGQFNDNDLTAIFLYLKSLPKTETAAP